MKLFEQKITYKTKELLYQMVEISKLNFYQLPDFVNINEKMTSFSFGRQKGHTTAAIEFLIENKNAILIVSNESMKNNVLSTMHNKYDIGLINQEVQVRIGPQYRVFSASNFDNRMRGMNLGSIDPVHSDVIILFDTVSQSKIYTILKNCMAERLGKRISAVVSLQSI